MCKLYLIFSFVFYNILTVRFAKYIRPFLKFKILLKINFTKLSIDFFHHRYFYIQYS